MSAVESDFYYAEDFEVTEAMHKSFDQNGFIILRRLLDPEELDGLREAVEHPEGVISHRYTRDDGEGRNAKISMWNQPGKDLTGAVASSQKLAGTFSKLLRGDVYHYHAKVTLKEARTGGAHVWHQDYGYWYENGCIFPNMGTVWIALDRATRDNGCLQIIRGSHLMGRIDHVQRGEQIGADLERVKQAQKFCELLHVGLEPGDALFFHCNVLHRSDQNSSDQRRYAFLASYNRLDNDPVYDHHHPKATPLEVLPNSAIKECKTPLDMDGKDFFTGANWAQTRISVIQKLVENK